jgi:Protein of unknown function DUF86
LRRAPVNSPGDGIAWVPVAPLRLRLLPASGLTFRRVAGPLPVSCSLTRPEPPAADRAWSLPGLWHRDDLSLSSRAGAAGSGQNAWVTFGEHKWVNFPERRSSDDLKALHPEVYWRAIAGFSNVLVHDYLGINLVRIWEIVAVHLPVLWSQMEAIRHEVDPRE